MLKPGHALQLSVTLHPADVVNFIDGVTASVFISVNPASTSTTLAPVAAAGWQKLSTSGTGPTYPANAGSMLSDGNGRLILFSGQSPSSAVNVLGNAFGS